MIIRPETSHDHEAITQVTLAAFTGKFSDHPTEHLIVNGLREAGALTLSLVAELDKKIVGHVAFSKVTINGEDRSWYGLGPISVQPELQKQGIGSKLNSVRACPTPSHGRTRLRVGRRPKLLQPLWVQSISTT